MGNVLDSVEVSITALDVEGGINELKIKELKLKATKYGERIMARAKDTNGKMWVVWLGNTDVAKMRQYCQLNSRSEDDLSVRLGVEPYTNKEGIEKKKIVVSEVF